MTQLKSQKQQRLGVRQTLLRHLPLHFLSQGHALGLSLLVATGLMMVSGAKGMANAPVSTPASAEGTIAQLIAQRAASFTVSGVLDDTSETLSDGSYVNAYPFEGEAGQTVVIELVSNDFDAYLLLVDPEGNLIAQDDDSAGGTDARIEITLPTTGRYIIGANSLMGGETGSYTLSLIAD